MRLMLNIGVTGPSRRDQDGVDLSILKIGDNRCTESPEEVHHQAPKGLEKWFGSPEEHRRGIHTHADWELALVDTHI